MIKSYWDDRYRKQGPVRTVGTVRWTQATYDQRRDATLVRVIRPFLAARGIGNVIDIGCGPGRFMEPLLSVADHYVGVDVSPEAIGIANDMLNRHEYYDRTSALFLTNEDFFKAQDSYIGTLDAAFSSVALQHITDDDELKAIIRRVVSLASATFRWLAVESTGPKQARHPHIVFRSPPDYCRLFQSCGLTAMHVMDFYDASVFICDKGVS
jgi:SAM-dependent methyltransferase